MIFSMTEKCNPQAYAVAKRVMAFGEMNFNWNSTMLIQE